MNHRLKRINIAEKPLTIWDYVIFFVLAGFCFLTFQQSDLIHTGSSSIAYLNGHFLDFYDYNAEYMGGNSYMPSSYILFAIWNIPLKLFGMLPVPSMDVPYVALMWYKALPSLFYVISAFLIYKIAMELGFGSKKAKICAFVFLGTPIGFFSQFIFGQYDIFTVFFMLLGIYFYFKHFREPKLKNLLLFILFFGISFTFKYFSLLIFIPLLLLREKRIWRILWNLALVAIPYALELLIYYPSSAFQDGVLGFGATGYIFNASIDTGFQHISLIVILWLAICAWAYFKDLDTKEDYARWFLYFANLIMFLVFGLSMWHPQWLLMAVPFWVMGACINKKFHIFMAVDILLMLVFVMFTVNFWVKHVDQNLFIFGIFQNIVPETLGRKVMMKDIFIIQNRDMLMSAFSGILLAIGLFKHPKFTQADFTESLDKHMALIRTRMILGVSIFVIPAFLCLFVALGSPALAFSGTGYSSSPADIVGPVYPGQEVSQVFSVDKDTINEISVQFGTYGRVNTSSLTMEIEDVETGKIIYSTQVNVPKIKDNSYTKLSSEPIAVEPGKLYSLNFSSEDSDIENCITIYRTLDTSAAPDGYAIIDGSKQLYNLCVDIY